MVQEASVTIVQQRMAFLSRIKVCVHEPCSCAWLMYEVLCAYIALNKVHCIDISDCCCLSCRTQEKLTAVHQRNQQKLKEGRKQALIGNTARFQDAMLHSIAK